MESFNNKSMKIVVANHAANLISIPGQVNFLIDFNIGIILTER